MPQCCGDRGGAGLAALAEEPGAEPKVTAAAGGGDEVLDRTEGEDEKGWHRVGGRQVRGLGGLYQRVAWWCASIPEKVKWPTSLLPFFREAVPVNNFRTRRCEVP